MDRKIIIHFYPYQLSSDDILTDGPFQVTENPPFKIESSTFLIWVDLMPEARFTHPTAYVLISANNTRIEKGGWWPVLNGQKILYGQTNPVSISSPFELDAKDIDPDKILSAIGRDFEPFIDFGSSTKIMSVKTVDVVIFKSNPPRLIISASGIVRTSGWANPKLRPRNNITKLENTMKEFDFLADPPHGIALQTLMPIGVTYQYSGDFSKWKGIEVFSETDSVKKIFGDPQIFKKSGHVLMDIGELPHGYKL